MSEVSLVEDVIVLPHDRLAAVTDMGTNASIEPMRIAKVSPAEFFRTLLALNALYYPNSLFTA
jgi:hypothetical protein